MEHGLVLTPEGYEKVLTELEELKSVRRREVAERIREAKQFGAPDENSAYEDAKAEQALVEGRIIELSRLLQNAVISTDPSANGDHVGVGSVVKVRQTGTAQEFEFTIVGPVEADPAAGKISHQSPVGEALMDHRAGDRVSAQTPAGSLTYEIISVTN